MRGHVDSETLAAFREGLLPRRKARRVAAHLAHCAQCAGLDTQLAELPALLARSHAPPIPAALTARIEAALAAEAAARSATTDTAAAAGAVTRDGAVVTPRHRKAAAPGPGRSRVALRAAAVAAAVVVLAGGGYGLSRLLAGGESGNSATPLAPVMGPEHGSAGSGAGGPVNGPLAKGAATSPGALTPRVVASGTDYQPGLLKTQVRRTLARFGTKLLTPRPAPHANLPAAFPGLRSCVLRIAGSRPVELVDVAHYEGRPAAIIVIPGARPNTLQVLVAGTSCSAAVPGPVFSTLLPSPG